MGEYVWTIAKVGGKISRAAADELNELGIDAIGDDAGDGGVNGAFEAKSSVFFHGECNYGNPEDFMTFCREHNLTYHVSYAAQPGCFGSGIYFWNPTMAEPKECDADDSGDPVVAYWFLEDALSKGLSLAGVVETLAAAHDKAVPPLELVDEEEKV